MFSIIQTTLQTQLSHFLNFKTLVLLLFVPINNNVFGDGNTCVEIMGLLNEDINKTYRNEFSSLLETHSTTKHGRIYREATKAYIAAESDHNHYHTEETQRKLALAEFNLTRSWSNVESEGKKITDTIKAEALEQGIGLEEASEPIHFSENIVLQTSRLVFSRSGNHPINRFADLLLRLEFNPVQLVIQPSFSAQGIRGVFSPSEKKLFIEPNVVFNATLSNQSIIHETIHLLLSEMVITGQIDPLWEMKFKSWTHLSRLPGHNHFYNHYMSVQELLTFGLTGIKAVYHLGQLEDEISKNERKVRLEEAINILEGTRRVAERIRLVANQLRSSRPSLSGQKLNGDPHVRARVSQSDSGVEDIKYDVFLPTGVDYKWNDDIPLKNTTSFYKSIDTLASIAKVFERVADLLSQKLGHGNSQVAMSLKEFNNILVEIRKLNLPIPVDTFLANPF